MLFMQLHEKKKTSLMKDYEPTVSVSTKKVNDEY